MLDPLQNAWLKDRQARVSEDRYRDAAVRTPAEERLEKAADALFSEYSIQLVTIQQIAERAETNSAYVLECFGSLDKLYAGYLRRYLDSQEDLWKRVEAAYPSAPEQQLRRWIEIIAAYPRGVFVPLPLSIEAVELGYRPDHAAHAVIRDHKAALRDNLAKRCEDANYCDAEGLALKLLLLIEGAAIHSVIFGSEGVGQRLLEAAHDLLARHSLLK